MQITGKTKILPLIGNPIDGVMSPVNDKWIRLCISERQ